MDKLAPYCKDSFIGAPVQAVVHAREYCHCGGAKSNKGFKVGITKLGEEDTIAPAVQKGNKELLNWINDEIVKLGKENFFHKDYEETLVDTYGLDYEDELVVEGGETNA